MTRRRALLAGVFAVLYPGLGHVYLREWFRAITWFCLALLTAALVVPGEVYTAYQAGGVSQVFEASQHLPLASVAALFLVRLLNVIDAVRLALTPRQDPDDTAATCPECGGSVDPELDFCHWCTTRLDQSPTNSGGGTYDRLS